MKIILYGELRKKYGSVFKCNGMTGNIGLRSLVAQLDGFKEDFKRGDYRIRIAKKDVTGNTDDEKLLGLFAPIGRNEVMHIVVMEYGPHSSPMKMISYPTIPYK